MIISGLHIICSHPQNTPDPRQNSAALMLFSLYLSSLIRFQNLNNKTKPHTLTLFNDDKIIKEILSDRTSKNRL